LPWTQLKFKAGVVKDATRYAASGTWYDSNLVRFRMGLAEMWGGWVQNSEFIFSGICRSLNRWADLNGFSWVGVGTSNRFYVVSDDVEYDVTPIASSGVINNNPFATTNGSPIVTVTDTAHGQFPGNVVIFSGGSVVAGLDLDAEFIITAYVDDDNYTITATSNANATTTGGGAAVTATYLYDPGSDNAISGGGWGSLTWGEEEWGGDPALGTEDHLGIWSQDNWGEDLVANPQLGPIFYWDATSPSARMVDILDLVGADGNAPTNARFILVSHVDRHLLAFGASEFSTNNPAPMSVRWCDQEDITNWDEASTTGTAGSLPLSQGSRLISAIAAQNEIIVWSDAALYSMQYIGAPYIYSSEIIERRSDILGLKACTVFGSIVLWMGRSGIYSYSGRVEKLDCPVWDYIQGRMNWSQAEKVVASTNRQFGEVIFFYPSTDGLEIDSYFTVNLEQGAWAVGALVRTAWLDMNTDNNPLAAGTDGYLYIHEVGSDDGSVTPAVALDAWIESAPIEMSSEGSFDKGDKFAFIRRILPDVTFRDYSNGVNTPTMNLVLKMMDKPGGGFISSSSSQVVRTAIIPVEEFTDDCHVRLRGRAMVLRAESSALGTQWRLGVPRIDVRTDGQR
jgi:hypothetical protein